MKLQGKFYSNIEDAKEEKKTYLSVIPAYENNPKTIYPVIIYDKFFIICDYGNKDTLNIASEGIEVINERLNFTKCRDLKILLHDVCDVKNSTLKCKLSDIKTIYAIMNFDTSPILEITFTNDEVITCKKIENIE